MREREGSARGAALKRGRRGRKEDIKEDEENVAYGSLQQHPETCSRFLRDAVSLSCKILIAR